MTQDWQQQKTHEELVKNKIIRYLTNFTNEYILHAAYINLVMYI